MTNATITLCVAAISAFAMAAAEGVNTVRYALNSNMIVGEGVAQSAGRAGDSIVIDWWIHKKTNCPGLNSRVWRSSQGYTLIETPKPTALPKTEDFAEYQIKTKIPDEAPTGPIDLTIAGRYMCSGMPSHDFALGPVKIEVVK